jgi:hypothetical protein
VLLHVLEGDVAASVDIVRLTRSEDGAAPAPDFTSGYRGLGLGESPGLAPVPTTSLTADPPELELSGPAYTATLAVSFVADGPRCLGFTASTDTTWLTVTPELGALPATLLLRAVPPSLEEPAEATVFIRANVTGVEGSPLGIPVRILVDETWRLYLPRAGAG